MCAESYFTSNNSFMLSSSYFVLGGRGGGKSDLVFGKEK